MVFETIEQIEAHDWTGSYAADSNASDAVSAFVAQQTDVEIARRALRVISEGMMGCPFDYPTDEQVLAEIAEAREYVGDLL